MTTQTNLATRFLDKDMSTPESIALAHGRAVLVVSKSPDREGPNEDAVAVTRLSDTSGVIILADGFGGHPSGA